ncbi:unnamed protein product [Clonostachys byssicola]|uniref:Cytochrome P450 n=1 Tax=Clonostachys byssicola TaxID=160290 RepID=A0A9N9UIP9_9HYPO|nr:unnamed protein product [Clonostachys byssicola]
MGSSVSVYLVAATLSCWLLHAMYQLLASPLRDIPGPFWARYTRLWYLYKSNAGNFHLDNIKLHDTYGKIVRVAPNMYSISSVDKAVYGVGSHFAKSDWYDSWKHPDPKNITLFSDTNIKRHNESRRRVQGMFSMSTMVSYEAQIHEINKIFLQKLHHFAETGETISLDHWLQCYAFDAVASITFSETFGFLSEGEDIDGMMAALDKGNKYSSWAGVYPELHPYLYPILERIPTSGASEMGKMIRFIKRMIAARRQQRTDEGAGGEKAIVKHTEDQKAPEDFLDKALNAQSKDPNKMTDAHIFALGWSNVSAGSDTTGVSLTAVLYHLSRNLRVLSKLLKEILAVEAEGKCNRDSFSFAQSQSMPYLQACIKEALRVHAAVGLPLWRVVPEGGRQVCGRHFPQGSVVGVNAWVAHSDEAVFGSDAQEFRPERWLEADEDELRALNAAWVPFGAGSRTCIGRHISMLEINKLLPLLLMNFEFELIGDKEWQTKTSFFVKAKQFETRIKARRVCH